MRNNKGVSLIEMMVVIAIFASVAIVITRSIVISLQGTQKSTTMIHTRENLNYALGVIERQIRNSNTVTSVCDGSTLTTIDYLDQNNVAASFSCNNIGNMDSYIASGSARLTNSDIIVSACAFSCQTSTEANPPVVSVSLTLSGSQSTGAANSNASAVTQIYLRNY